MKQFLGQDRIGLSAGLPHNLSHKELKEFFLAAAVFLHLRRIGCEDSVYDLSQFSFIGNLSVFLTDEGRRFFLL